MEDQPLFPTPFYLRGLAQPGMDGPFHKFESVCLQSGKQGVKLEGGAAALEIFKLGFAGRAQSGLIQIPHTCPDELAHQRRLAKCAPDCTCDHNKFCETNKGMWRTIEQQKEQEGFRYAGHLSDSMAQHLLSFYLDDIEIMRCGLAYLLESHGDLILRRWKKMSKDKRGQLLCTVASLAFGRVWPPESSKCGTEDCIEMHTYAWPHGEWLNARHYASDYMRLLSLLHARTEYKSADWYLFDDRNGWRSWTLPAYPLWFSDKCVVVCGDNFGTLRDYNKELTHAHAVIGFPRASLVFSGQHDLMATLHAICKAIIHGDEGTGSVAWARLADSGFGPAGSDAAWDTYLNQPLAPPVHFDPHLLLWKATDRLNIIKDELWLMQTGPPYMQDLILSKRMAISNNSSGLDRQKQMSLASAVFMLETLSRFHMWQSIVLSCEKLVKAFDNYPHLYEPGTIMPPQATDQKNALQKIILKYFAEASASFESMIFSTQLGYGQVHLRQNQGNDHLMIRQERQLDPNLPVDRLKWRLNDVRKRVSHMRPTTGFNNTFELIEREEAVMSHMDKPTLDHISDLMLMDELTNLLVFSQRGHRYARDDADDMRDCYDDPDVRAPKLVFVGGWLQRVSVCIEAFMKIQWPKGRKDLRWLEQADASRSLLRELWDRIAKEHEKAEEAGGKKSKVGTKFTSSLAFDTEPEYLAALQQEREECQAESDQQLAQLVQSTNVVSAQQPQTVWGNTNENVSPVCRKQTKAKAARAATSIEQDLATLQMDDQQPSISQLAVIYEAVDIQTRNITVKKESLAVFKKMFAEGEGAGRHSIRWPIFVQAMVDAGFMAREAAGSAVSFSNDAGSISFHRPHPDPVIEPIMLQSMARRMHKWFGWHGGLFVERTKEEKSRI